MAYRLIDAADTAHETAEEWWADLGYHVTTEEMGDICHPICEVDDLGDCDEDLVRKLLARDSAVNECPTDEGGRDLVSAYSDLVAYAREAWAAATTIAGLLETAVAAYHRGDLEAVLAALDEASQVENEYGDDPATWSLRSRLIEDEDD